MRKLFALLVAVALASGAALAQDTETDIDVDVDTNLFSVDYGTTQWAGVALGYPFAVYYGVEDVFQDADVRGRLSTSFFDVTVGGDVLFDITELEDVPVTIYGGGGPNVSIAFFGGFGFGLSGVVGAEWRFDEQIGAFLDVGVGYTFYIGSDLDLVPLAGLSPRGALGVNFHF